MFESIRRRLSRKFIVGREIEIEGEKFEIVQITKRGLALRVKQQQDQNDNSTHNHGSEPDYAARR